MGAGTEYLVTQEEWDGHRHLASVDGHPAGPGLSWWELAHLAGTSDLDAPGVHEPHARLLLLLPALRVGVDQGCRWRGGCRRSR
ncbi:hypothetical protein ACWGI1_14960 [Streptomyces sp. NPDC054835]